MIAADSKGCNIIIRTPVADWANGLFLRLSVRTIYPDNGDQMSNNRPRVSITHQFIVSCINDTVIKTTAQYDHCTYFSILGHFG